MNCRISRWWARLVLGGKGWRCHSAAASLGCLEPPGPAQAGAPQALAARFGCPVRHGILASPDPGSPGALAGGGGRAAAPPAARGIGGRGRRRRADGTVTALAQGGRYGRADDTRGVDRASRFTCRG